MKTFKVTIKGSIEKTYLFSAHSPNEAEDLAMEEAYEEFVNSYYAWVELLEENDDRSES